MARSFVFNPFTGNFDVISAVTLTAVGGTPNANGASITALGQALTLQPADGSNPGVITTGTQTIGGAKTFAATANFSSAVNITGGNLDMGSHFITSLLDPTSSQQAATKNYVDLLVAGIYQIGVKAATTANIAGTYVNGVAGVGATLTVTATGVLTIDGVATALNDRVLIKNQSSGLENGVYAVTTAGATGVSAVLTRATDYDTPSEINGSGLVPVTGGTVNGTTSWQQVNTVTTVGTDSLSFTEFSANPSLYLLKSNNLSDVASASTAFNNISPVTSTGDLIIGNGANSSTRLGIGSNTFLLTSNGTTATWAALTIPAGSLPTITLTGAVTGSASGGTIATSYGGVVPLNKGGTNNALNPNGNRIMISTGTAIVEQTAITGSRAIVSDASGLPTASPATSGEVGFLSGVTANIQTQLNGKQATIGVLPIANGGTANGSLAVTAGGTIYTDGTKLVNVGAGTAGTFLKSNGASAPSWAAAGSILPITSVSTTYSILTTDAVVFGDTSAGAFTVTLPTAVGNTGMLVQIKNVGTVPQRALTIATTASQSIDGASSYICYIPNEEVYLISNGANWNILSRFQPTIAASCYCSANRTASTSAPWNFDTKEYDTASSVTTGASWQFNPPALGEYQVTVVPNGVTAGTDLMAVYKNGAYANSLGTVSSSVIYSASTTMRLSPGDQIDIRTTGSYTITGGSVNTVGASRITITKIGF